MTREATITTKIDELLGNEEEAKLLDRKGVEEMLDGWMDEYRLTQPTEYFLEHPTDDYELFCNVQTEKEFLMNTLEIFGLPDKYMEGNGHFPDWGLEKKDDRLAAAKKRALASKMKNKKTNAALTKIKQARGLDQKDNNE